MWSHLRAWLSRITYRIAGWARSVAGWFSRYAHAVAERHRDRMSSDTTYRSALIHASTAGATVLFAQPAIAAAIGVLISEHVRPRRTRTVSSPGVSRGLWDADWDDEEDTFDSDRDWPRYRP